MSTKVTKRAQKTSSFNRKTSLTTNVSTNAKVSVGIFEGSISMSVGQNKEWSYGEQETISDDREYNFPLVIAPYKQINVSIMVTQKQADINYRARLRGVNTGYEIWEDGTWENVDCTDIIVSLVEYDVTSGQPTGRTKTLKGVPTTPTGMDSGPTGSIIGGWDGTGKINDKISADLTKPLYPSINQTVTKP
jgi:hypothetical protein